MLPSYTINLRRTSNACIVFVSFGAVIVWSSPACTATGVSGPGSASSSTCTLLTKLTIVPTTYRRITPYRDNQSPRDDVWAKEAATVPGAGATLRSEAASRIQTYLICACLLAATPEFGVARAKAAIPSSSYTQPSAIAFLLPPPSTSRPSCFPPPSAVSHQNISHAQMSASHPPARCSGPRRPPFAPPSTSSASSSATYPQIFDREVRHPPAIAPPSLAGIATCHPVAVAVLQPPSSVTMADAVASICVLPLTT